MKGGRAPVVVTGASGSMGAVAVLEMARKGYPVIMACRNPDKAQAVRSCVLAEVPDAALTLRPLDLRSLDSVRSFADDLGGRPLSALFNNAGVINRDYALTGDGFESTLAVNYLAPFLLTRLLLPCLQPSGHIVNMVSVTCSLASLDEDFLHPAPERYSQLGNYAASKLALLLFSLELGRRYPLPLHVHVADPGVVNSNMIRMDRWFDPIADLLFRPFCKRPEQGAAPAVRALEAPGTLRLFKGRKELPIPARFSLHPILSRIWDMTEAALADRGADKVR